MFAISVLLLLVGAASGRGIGASGGLRIHAGVRRVQGGAAEGHPPGADEFDYAEGAHLLDEGINLALVSRDLEDEGAARHVHDARAEVLRHLPDLDAFLGVGHPYLDEHELAVHVLGHRVVYHFDHVEQLLELLLHLLQGGVVAHHDERGAAEPGLLRPGHRERLDVETAPGDEAGYAHQHAGAVAHGDADDVAAHASTTSRSGFRSASSGSWSPRITSSIPAPAGTMGNTFSASYTKKLRRTGFLAAIASPMRFRASSLSNTLWPSMP